MPWIPVYETGVIVPSHFWQNGCGGTELGRPLKILSSSSSWTINSGTYRWYPHLVQTNSIRSSSSVKPSKISKVKSSLVCIQENIFQEELYDKWGG